jgi:hypothetical protein
MNPAFVSGVTDQQVLVACFVAMGVIASLVTFLVVRALRAPDSYDAGTEDGMPWPEGKTWKSKPAPEVKKAA